MRVFLTYMGWKVCKWYCDRYFYTMFLSAIINLFFFQNYVEYWTLVTLLSLLSHLSHVPSGDKSIKGLLFIILTMDALYPTFLFWDLLEFFSNFEDVFLSSFKLCMCLCGYVHFSADIWDNQKRSLESLEVQVAVIHLVWMLGTQL